jgi:hypothetical protein
MNTREAVIEEIRSAPETMVKEVLDFVRFLQSRPAVEPDAPVPPRVMPDFQAAKRRYSETEP